MSYTRMFMPYTRMLGPTLYILRVIKSSKQPIYNFYIEKY